MTESVSNANNYLAINLFRGVTSDTNDGNDIISPISVSSAFGMLHLGANGDTAKELRNVLGYNKFGLSNDNVHEGFKKLMTEISERSKSNDANVLTVANRIMAQNEFPLLSNYTDKLKENYEADVQSVDFVTDGQRAVDTINEWVKTQTKNKIEKLFDEPLDSNTRLVIVNAVYFKGNWLLKFPITRTHDDTFLNKGVTPKEVPMMSIGNKKWNFITDETLDSQIIELPYIGNDLSMFVILPRENNGLSKLKSVLTQENLEKAIKSLRPLTIDVFLPKFKVEKEYQLLNPMSSLGLNKVFTTEADLSGINGKRDLQVSKIVHKVVIDVNEEGSEAAAATGIQITLYSARISPVFRADHPFIFMIRDKRNGMILFLGQINEL